MAAMPRSMYREKLKATEDKLRAAVSERQTAQSEKLQLGQRLKQLEGQQGRLTKDLEKKVPPVGATKPYLRPSELTCGCTDT